MVVVDNENLKPTPQIVSILIGSKSQSTIKTISPFSPSEISSVRISIFGKIEYLYSSILQHLARNPDISIEVEDIKSISKDKLIAILSYRYLNVSSEDKVLNMVGK